MRGATILMREAIIVMRQYRGGGARRQRLRRHRGRRQLRTQRGAIGQERSSWRPQHDRVLSRGLKRVDPSKAEAQAKLVRARRQQAIEEDEGLPRGHRLLENRPDGLAWLQPEEGEGVTGGA